MKRIVWKINDICGKSAYVGSIRIGRYHYNGIDSQNGKYKVTSFMPQSNIENLKVNTDEEAQALIIKAFETFISKIIE